MVAAMDGSTVGEKEAPLASLPVLRNVALVYLLFAVAAVAYWPASKALYEVWTDFSNLGGTVFFAAGHAFDDRWPKTFNADLTHLELNDARADVGFGVYMDVGYFLTSVQFAWPTDLYHFENEMQVHFYLGPTF